MMGGQRKRPSELTESLNRFLGREQATGGGDKEGHSSMSRQSYHGTFLEAVPKPKQGMVVRDLPGPQCIGEGPKTNAA